MVGVVVVVVVAVVGWPSVVVVAMRFPLPSSRFTSLRFYKPPAGGQA